MNYYHATEIWNGGDLEPLYERLGDEAYQEYARRWPESDGLGTYHAHQTHLHDSLGQAIEFSRDFGGEVLLIKVDADSGFDVVRDGLEYDHPVVEGSIPASAINRVNRNENYRYEVQHPASEHRRRLPDAARCDGKGRRTDRRRQGFLRRNGDDPVGRDRARREGHPVPGDVSGCRPTRGRALADGVSPGGRRGRAAVLVPGRASCDEAAVVSRQTLIGGCKES